MSAHPDLFGRDIAAQLTQAGRVPHSAKFKLRACALATYPMGAWANLCPVAPMLPRQLSWSYRAQA